MTSLMKALYEFTEEKHLGQRFLDEEYNKYWDSAYKRFEKLIAEYPQIMQELDDLVGDLSACRDYAQEAAFQAGFLMHGELLHLRESYDGILQ